MEIASPQPFDEEKPMGQQRADNDPQRFIPEEPPVADIDDPVVSDLPQDVTESYGTGVQDLPGYSAGGRTMRDRRSDYTSVSPELSGGDVDAAWDQAENTAEETVGGTVATPDQDIVDDLGQAVGTEMRDRQDFYGSDQLNIRDQQRWELDEKSSEDYPEWHNYPEQQQDQ
jgi:hypothetical protein